MPRPTEEEKIYSNIKRRFSKATTEYALTEENDRILVGLSGGKDSLTMLQLLAERSRIHKPHIEVEAVYVSMVNIPYKSNVAFLEDFCREQGVLFHHRECEFDASTDTRKSPCFLCSWNRRKALFEVAQERGCNKIALGHNMDDFIETLLMNISFQGAFSAMAPSMKMNKFPVTIIRPLCLVSEKEIEKYAAIKGFPKQEKKCPYESSTNRKQMKNLLEKLEELNPEVRYNIWGAMSNVQSELLPPKIDKKQ